jgi:hypothetical protein
MIAMMPSPRAWSGKCMPAASAVVAAAAAASAYGSCRLRDAAIGLNILHQARVVHGRSAVDIATSAIISSSARTLTRFDL